MQTKIAKNNIEDIITLTPMQEGMLFHYIKDPTNLEYHEQVSINLEGDIDSDLLQQAWDFVIKSNEMLRVVYRWKNISKPVQIVLKNHRVVMRCYDFSGSDSVERGKCLEEIKQVDLQSRIDIEKETLRVALCKCAENQFTMIISHHHILYDGWSNAIIIKELISAYGDLFRGLGLKETFKNKFSEYVKWLGSQDKAKQKIYWENYLNGVVPNDDLFSRASLTEVKSYHCVLGKDVKDQLVDFAKENGISVATVLYVVWGCLVQKLNNTHDIMFGITTSGRNNPIKGTEHMVGLFINTIPLRISSHEEQTVLELLKKVNERIKEGHEFESTPLVEINAYAGLDNPSQLFNSLVVIENYPLNMEDYQEGVLKINDYSTVERTNYNLTLAITIQDTVKINFQSTCFEDGEMIKRMSQYFATILSAVIADKQMKVVEIDILSKDEREKILNEFNDPSADYPRDKTLHQLFEEQVIKTPDNVALIFGEERMIYRELNAKANLVANMLRADGVEVGEIVGIMVERSPLMIIGILGILKSGGAYLPIDSIYPEERIKFMLADSGAKILLTQSGLSEKVEFDGKRLNLDEVLYTRNVENLDQLNRSNDLAYIIYTSGSTGVPKGVMIEHRNVVRLLFNDRNLFDFTEKDVWTMFHSFCFDFSVWEMYGALLYGGKLIIIDVATTKDVNQFVRLCETQNVTILNQTPSAFYQFIKLATSNERKDFALRKVIFGGEQLIPEMLLDFNTKYPQISLINMYGITETTVHATYKLLSNMDMRTRVSNIGRPIPTLTAYILDQNKMLCPLNITGELYISGDGLARGYLNRPALTAERFIPNLFLDGERMYRTGDLARWLPNGNIEYLGRIDHQVKIRGFRIELGEIESQILKHDRVKEVVVLAREDETKDKYLVAYMVSEGEISKSEMRQHLSKTLPYYLIPTTFMRLEQMPLTSNKKIDRKALPEPVENRLAAYIGPRNEIERMLTKIWSEVLNKEKIGINDNFFELGGHSLKATVLISRINEQFNRDEPVVMLFRYPTVKGMADYLHNDKDHETELRDREAFVQSRKDKMKKRSKKRSE